MNFYKIFDEKHKRTQSFNLDIVQCFVIDDAVNTVDFYYGARDHINIPLTNELIKKLKEIGALKNDEKDVKKVSNGVSVNTISNPLLCSNCIVEVGNERKL